MIRGRRFGIGFAAALLVTLAGGPPVWRVVAASTPHPHLEKSKPEAGETVKGSLEHVWLLFSEEVNAKTSRISVETTDGAPIELEVEPDGSTKKAIIGTLPTLAPGDYTLSWFVVGSDGHPVSGDFAFRVDQPEADSEP